MTIPLIIGGVLLAILILLILVFITKYRTVGPDEALIVTGNWLGGGKNVVTTDDGKKIKIIRGGGTFVVPIMQRAEPLSLLNYKLEVGTRDTYTKQGVPVTVNGVSIIKVGSTIEEVSTAAEQYLGKETEELKVEAKEVLEGHLRAILSSMTVEDAYSNREQFAQKVHEVASTDLKKMGLRIVSFTIKEIMDKNGYLDALGQPQIATVKRDATIANAEREKEARIEKARAEKEAKEAEYQRDAQIAEAEKQKELKVQEIARREKQYDAEVKKKADADRYAVEQSAEAEKVKQI
ncbi:flotillin family protein, partial [Bacillus cereus group sp. BfR-BA-01423]|uniref:flotillin family protein n=1 Tax=Bacillus cereus group sp. BfR-BA-01423 TaxID=2920340 RepID=UPI001F57E685